MFPFQFLVPVHVATTNDYVKIKTYQEKLSSGYGFVGDKMKGSENYRFYEPRWPPDGCEKGWP